MVTFPGQLAGQVVRSRPFLLFVLIVLVGFLWIHYVEPGVAMETVDDNSGMVRPGRRAIKSTNSSGLFKDQLSAEDIFNESSLIKIINKSKSFLDLGVNHNISDTLELSKGPKKVLPKMGAASKCRKQFDVSFLKVHKAGSTTVMNIFLRFAIEHNLNIVLPHKSDGFGFNYLGYGKTVSRDTIVPLPANEHYNILCNHVVYNRDAFRSIMPADTVYVGILREPVSHFISAASYYGFYKHLKDLNASTFVMSEFLKNPTSFNVGTYFVHNRMSFDFGIPKKEFYNANFVEKNIQELDKDYKLVMILERFPESLVLLRRTLCWSTKDILYVPLNAMKNKPDFHLDEIDLQRLKNWNKADFKLYGHFRARFDSLVEAQGQDLQDEVKSFTDIKQSVSEFCAKTLHSKFNEEALKHFPETKWDSGFYVGLRDCQLMTESELPMMSRLIKNAWQRFTDSNS